LAALEIVARFKYGSYLWAVGALLGIINYEVVSIRWLKLAPSTR